MFLHGLELGWKLLNDLDGLFGIAFCLHNGLLFFLFLVIQFLLEFDNLMSQSLEFLLVEIGDVFGGELVLVAKFFDDLSELCVLFDEFFNVEFKLIILPDEIFDVDRVIEGLLWEFVVWEEGGFGWHKVVYDLF